MLRRQVPLGSRGVSSDTIVDLRFEGVAGSSGVAIGSATVIAPPADLASVPDKEAKDIQKEINKLSRGA